MQIEKYIPGIPPPKIFGKMKKFRTWQLQRLGRRAAAAGGATCAALPSAALCGPLTLLLANLLPLSDGLSTKNLI